MNNAHIDFDKDTNDVLNKSIVKLIDDGMKIILNEDMFVFFMLDNNSKLLVKYSKRDDINESIF